MGFAYCDYDIEFEDITRLSYADLEHCFTDNTTDPHDRIILMQNQVVSEIPTTLIALLICDLDHKKNFQELLVLFQELKKRLGSAIQKLGGDVEICDICAGDNFIDRNGKTKFKKGDPKEGEIRVIVSKRNLPALPERLPSGFSIDQTLTTEGHWFIIIDTHQTPVSQITADPQ